MLNAYVFFLFFFNAEMTAHLTTSLLLYALLLCFILKENLSLKTLLCKLQIAATLIMCSPWVLQG